MLELAIKATAAGIPYRALAKTPIAAITLGWEAEKRKLYEASVPVIEGQLAKLSPVQLGKADGESESAEDIKHAEVGRRVIERIKEGAHFRAMPYHMQAAWLREHGRLPADDKRGAPIKGFSRVAAKEIISLGDSGSVPDSAAYWKFYSKYRVRLHASA